jgi:ERCC4-type nuclease
VIYLSPTEHDLRAHLRSIPVEFVNSPICEANGVDVIIPTRVGLVGFQRKRLPDLESSLRDGRLAKELGQIRSSGILRHAGVVAEYDSARITTDGYYLDTRLSQHQVRNLSLKIQLLGLFWIQSSSVADTYVAINGASEYIASNRADDLYRPKPPTDAWGRRTSKDWCLHILQSFPDIGPRTANAIYEAVGLPLGWLCTRDQLLAIPGVGPKTADALLDALRVLPPT